MCDHIDGNSAALNNHLNEQSRDETAQENFEEDARVNLNCIEDHIIEIKQIAAKYTGYDFTDVIKERILEML